VEVELGKRFLKSGYCLLLKEVKSKVLHDFGYSVLEIVDGVGGRK